MPGAKNIYLSDDDADDRELFEKAFENVCPEHNLTIFDNNGLLLNNLKAPGSVIPDIIFIDLNMPKLNGVECLRIIKEQPHLSKVPVIVYSTIETSLFVEEVYELGAALFIKKPYDFYELAHMIKYVVDYDWNTDDIPSLKEFLLTYSTLKKPL